MIKRPFEQWLFEDVEIEFGINRIDNMPELEQWLTTSKDINITPSIEKLRYSLLKNVETWNEDELKMMFIAPFLVNFQFNNKPYYRVFTQRHRSLKTEKIEANGKVEWMIPKFRDR